MYDLTFQATDDADWAQRIEIIDATTNLPMDVSDVAFNIEVSEHGCGPSLSGSTDDGTITRPDDNSIQWIFTKDQMNGLRVGTTYKVGCTMTTNQGTQQLFVGSLALIGGGFR